MKSWKSLVPFIILNIIISAATTMTVLWWWNHTKQAEVPSVGSTLDTTIAEISELQAAAIHPQDDIPTPPPLDQPIIEIQNVFGAGDVQTEVVLLSRLGDGDLWLTGWQLLDEEDHVYAFPKLLLNRDGAVQLYTRPGPDTVIELFWGLQEPIWHTGETVTLQDSQGNLRASYQIP